MDIDSLSKKVEELYRHKPMLDEIARDFHRPRREPEPELSDELKEQINAPLSDAVRAGDYSETEDRPRRDNRRNVKDGD